MRDKLASMTEHVQANLKAAGNRRKKWYDRHARDKRFTAGDQVLVLLPFCTSKQTAQWQGPYQVKRVGEFNYLIYLPDHKRKRRVLHVNMLQKWHQPPTPVLLSQEAPDAISQMEVPVWNELDQG